MAKNYSLKINLDEEKSNLIKYLEIDKLSLSKVAKIYNVARDTIKKAAILLNINIDTQLSNKRKDVSWNKEDLEYYFFTKGLTTGQVAKIYNVSNHSVVLRAAKRLGIDTNKVSNGYLDISESELVKLVFEDHYSLLDLINYFNSSKSVINKFLRKYGIVKLTNGTFYKKDLLGDNYNEDGRINNKFLPVPLKYTYVDNQIIKIRRGKENNSIRYYYIPELGRWIRYSQISKRLKSFGITDSMWVNKWIGRAKDSTNLSKDEARRVVDFKYKDRLPKTKEYITASLIKDYSYKCNFFSLKEDIIDWIFTDSRNILIKNYLNFSNIPSKISTKLSIFNIIDLRNNSTISLNFKYLESDKDILFNKYFGFDSITNNDLINLSEYERKYIIKKYSTGELLTIKWLNENNILYSDVNTIHGIEGRNSKIVRPDFIIKLKDKIIWLEYNGKQHYKELKFFHPTREKFENQLKRDQNVRDYCKKNNIILIEIPYIINTYEKVKDFLDKVILQGVDPNTLIDYKSLYKIN